MPCIFVLVGMAAPRTLLFFIWLLTNWFTLCFKTSLWPFLGFCFFPYTTLTYLLAMLQNDGHVSGIWLVVVVIGVLFDLSCWGAAPTTNRRAA